MNEQAEHVLELKDDDDGDVFGRNTWLWDGIDMVLDAFEDWGVEGYYDADAQEEMRNKRTKALTTLGEARAAFELFWAECSCGWKSRRYTDEAQAEQAWEEHAYPEAGDG